MVSAVDIAARMKGKKKPPVADEEGSPEEEASEPADEAMAEGDVPPEGDAEMGDYDSIEDSAVDDMMAAVKADDRDGFKAGLRDFVRACMDRGDEGGGE